MIYRKQRMTTSLGGFHHFHDDRNQMLHGYGDGDYIRLRDEFGNIWRGSAERDSDHSVKYRFRNDKGHSISGISDQYGIILRDEKGKSWRGFVD